MANWRFRQMQPGELNIDPIEEEFFSTAALDSVADALVRESVQNALDARLGHDRVRVRFAFPPRAAATSAAPFLAGLRGHLGAVGSGMQTHPALDEPFDCVVIEDFGTRGLQGDPTQSEDVDDDGPAARNDFYYFWRNVGRSRKGRAELGRWGLGKTVFPAASRINAFLALTVRANDERSLLMGQSVLRIHRLNGRRYYPYGYFGEFEGELALPIDDPTRVSAVSELAALSRRGEPGLSVVVPWPDPEIAPESILPSVIRHYFVPILDGTLEIEVSGPAGTDRLDRETLPELLERGGFRAADPNDAALGAVRGESFARLVALARYGHSRAPAEHFRLAAPPAEAAPRWGADLVLPAELRKRYEGGFPLAFSVPVWVKPEEAEPVLAEFAVYLERDPTLARAEEHFVREGITVTGVRGGLPKGNRAIVIARNPALVGMLGDAENPAHTEWQERSPMFRDRYLHGPFTLRYVRNASKEIARALNRPEAGRNEVLLRHVFALPTERAVLEAVRRGAETPGPGESAAAQVRDVSAGAAPSFLLRGVAGGFVIASSGNAAGPQHARVEVAYDVRSGDPFARYEPPDFDLAGPAFGIDAEGGALLRARANSLLVRIDSPAFRLDIQGFDPNRDIRVRITPLDGPPG